MFETSKGCLCDNRSCVGYRLWSTLSAVSLVSLIEVAVNGTGVAAVKQPKSGSIGQVDYPNKKTHYCHFQLPRPYVQCSIVVLVLPYLYS
jgi:hypothetical protein